MTFKKIFLPICMIHRRAMDVVGFERSLLAGTAALLLLWTISFTLVGGSDEQLLPYEPLQYLRTVSPSVSGDSVWTEFVELSAQEVGELTAEMKAKLKAHLAKSGTSVVFAKGERVLTQLKTSKLKWDSPIEVPFSNTLSVISLILPILLENYKHSMIGDSIGKVLKGEDLDSPLVKGRESRSFLDLLNKLPKSDDAASLDLNSGALLKELNSNGELALYFANTVLGQSTKEAWTDALLSIGMEDLRFSQGGHLIMSLNSLLQYCLTVLHDFRLLGVVPKSEILTPDDNRYLFGWWQNCPKSNEASECLLPNLPEDTVFSLSPNVRLHISPSLELLLIIVGPNASPVTASGSYSAKKELKSISEIIQADSAIWEQVLSVVSAEESGMSSSSSDGIGASQSNTDEQRREEKNEKAQKRDEREKEEEEGQGEQRRGETQEQSQSEKPPPSEELVEEPERSELAEWIHWLWPSFLFLFWVTVSHVWVYWMLHCVWYILTRFSKRAHIPRPKTAADAGPN